MSAADYESRFIYKFSSYCVAPSLGVLYRWVDGGQVGSLIITIKEAHFLALLVMIHQLDRLITISCVHSVKLGVGWGLYMCINVKHERLRA